jgi:hypothetical protein
VFRRRKLAFELRRVIWRSGVPPQAYERWRAAFFAQAAGKSGRAAILGWRGREVL